MVDEKLLNQVLKYYQEDHNIANICPFLIMRETALLNKGERIRYNEIRNIRIFNKKNFDFNIKARILKNKVIYNIYYSLATYKNGVPLLNYLGYTDEEKAFIKLDWSQNYWKTITDYDWLIDIDSPDLKSLGHCAQDTYKICLDLDKKGIVYSVRFSGCGFHIITRYTQIPKYKDYSFNPFDKKNIYIHCNKLNKKYHDKISEMVDYSINDARRIIKVPNTIVYNPIKTNETLLICKIINRDDLKNFDYKRYIYDFTKLI